MSHKTHAAFVHAKNARVIGLANASRTRGYRVESRKEIRRRATDHVQDLAGRRLLFVRLNQLAVTRLEFPQRLGLALGGLRQALLKVAGPRALVLGRLGGDRELGLGL
jgi:hypothetical protein